MHRKEYLEQVEKINIALNDSGWEGPLFDNLNILKKRELDSILDSIFPKIKHDRCFADVFDIVFQLNSVYNEGNTTVLLSQDTEAEARHLKDVLVNEIGYMILQVDIYRDYYQWYVDCTFAGAYVPWWTP